MANVHPRGAAENDSCPKRIAENQVAYSECEFLEWFGPEKGKLKWENAIPEVLQNTSQSSETEWQRVPENPAPLAVSKTAPGQTAAERIQMADHLRELNRRAMSEVDAASSKAAWAEWEAIPIGLRLRWHARRRFLIEWTADLLFVVERAILGRVFTGWHVVKLTADLQAERAAAAGLEDSSTEGDSSTCASDADADGDASQLTTAIASDADTDGDAS